MHDLLDDLPVVSISETVAANFAGRCLADMGATVVKLEKMPHGDPCRNYPPHTSDGDPPSSLFAYVAAGTLSVSTSETDLRERLLAEAAVILHDHVDEPLEIAREAERRQFSPLAIVAITPYGQLGPKRGVPGTDLTLYQAGGEGFLMPSGLAYDEAPHAPPLLAGRYVPSYQAGLVGTLGALAALRLSRASLHPERVDISIQDSQIVLNHLVLNRMQEGVLERRSNRSFRYGGVLRCRDGYAHVLTLEKHQWDGLREMIDAPDWLRDPSFDNELVRSRRGGEINAAIRAWAIDRTTDDVVAAARRHGVPAATFASPAELPHDEQLRSREFFASGTDLPAVPYRFADDSKRRPGRRAPRLGEHTALLRRGFAEVPRT